MFIFIEKGVNNKKQMLEGQFGEQWSSLVCVVVCMRIK